ncbi:hypothetical protein ES708_28802 [subsurface metagenome]
MFKIPIREIIYNHIRNVKYKLKNSKSKDKIPDDFDLTLIIEASLSSSL